MKLAKKTLPNEVTKVRHLKERLEPTQYLKQPWTAYFGAERVTFTPRYDPGERVLETATSDFAVLRAPVGATRAEVEALYRERFQR